jgi:lambda family phage tail tape measure protein
MAENIDVNVNVNTSQAQRNLDTLNKSFGAMKSALAGLALGGFITGILNAAKNTMDLAQATGFATASILGLQKAFVANGGSAEEANNAIVKLTQNIGEAAQGSSTLQSAFQQVGVSLQDLATLSEEQIFIKTIQGLAGINDSATRTALGLQLLGKSAKTIDYAGIASGAKSYITASRDTAIAIENADAAAKKLEQALQQIKDAVVIAIQPLTELASQINVNADAIQKFVKIATNIAIIVGAFSLLGKAVTLVRGGFALFVRSGKELGKTLSVLKHYWDRLTGAITVEAPKNNLFAGLAKSVGFLLKSLAGLGTVIGTVLSALFPDQVLNAFKELGQLIGLVDDESTAAANAEKDRADKAKRAAEEEAEQKRKVIAANNEMRASILRVADAYNEQISELQKTIALETRAFEVSSDQLELEKALSTVAQNNADAVKALVEQRSKLKKEQEGLIPVIDQQITKLREQLAVDQATTAAAIQGLQARRLEQEKLNDQLELTKQNLSDAQALQSLQAQLAVIGMYGEELQNNLMILNVTEELQRKLTDLEVRRLELENQRTQLGEARFAQEMAHLEALRNAAYEYANARIEGEKKILEAQKAVQENAQLGVEQAIADIAKQFEPYQMAQDAVKQGWGRVSDALDTFVETGKLKFSDLARSILADLAKMILKAMVFRAISGIAGAFGLSIPGLAKGGSAKAGEPYIVGEKGPELFVPQGNGTVIPNNQLGSKGMATGAVNAPVTNNYITNNISAIDAKSVAQLFAENRKTLLGSVKMAEREMPYMAR